MMFLSLLRLQSVLSAKAGVTSSRESTGRTTTVKAGIANKVPGLEPEAEGQTPDGSRHGTRPKRRATTWRCGK